MCKICNFFFSILANAIALSNLTLFLIPNKGVYKKAGLNQQSLRGIIVACLAT